MVLFLCSHARFTLITTPGLRTANYQNDLRYAEHAIYATHNTTTNARQKSPVLRHRHRRPAHCAPACDPRKVPRGQQPARPRPAFSPAPHPQHQPAGGLHGVRGGTRAQFFLLFSACVRRRRLPHALAVSGHPRALAQRGVAVNACQPVHRDAGQLPHWHPVRCDV